MSKAQVGWLCPLPCKQTYELIDNFPVEVGRQQQPMEHTCGQARARRFLRVLALTALRLSNPVSIPKLRSRPYQPRLHTCLRKSQQQNNNYILPCI